MVDKTKLGDKPCQKTIILEPKGCEEKCASIRDMFKQEVEDKAVVFLSLETEAGQEIARSLGMNPDDIKDLKSVIVADLKDVIEIEEIEPKRE